MSGDLARDFLVPEDMVYLATAGESLPLRSQSSAVCRYMDAKRRGEVAHGDMYGVVDRCRKLVGRLLGTDQNVGFVSSTSEALASLLRAVRFQPGDNVVVSEIDFVSNRLASLPLSTVGIETRVIPADEGQVRPELYDELVDTRTRLVVISAVSHWSGFRHDLRRVSEIVHSKGALLAVDATQALGVASVPFEVCDILVASTYKWLLGIPGVALICCQREAFDRLAPTVVGRHGVERWINRHEYCLHRDSRAFEMGFPNFVGLYVLEDSLTYLERLGVQRIAEVTASLVDGLIEGVRAMNLSLLTPLDRCRRAAIVSVRTSRYAEVVKRLLERGICVSAGDGRIRISPYIYNNQRDVQTVLEALDELSPLLAAG